MASAHLHAQTTNMVTFTAAAQLQGATNDNGVVSTISPPAKLILNTRQILAYLAQDEFASGNYASATFPEGAKLMAPSWNGIFQVWDKENNLLVVVTNVLTRSQYTNFVVSGKRTDATGLSDRTITASYIWRITYNDSAIAGGAGLTFYLQGLTKDTITESAPSAAGTYTETILNVMSGATGDGYYQGTPLVVSGSQTVSGKAVHTLSP